MSLKQIDIADYNYFLSESKIAKYPLDKRDESALLVYENGFITDDLYENADKYIPANSLLVFNNSRVIKARILFEKTSGGFVEIFCLELLKKREYNNMSFVECLCLVKGGKRLRDKKLVKQISTQYNIIELHAEIKGKLMDAYLVEFCWSDGIPFFDLLELTGEVPIPPYLHRSAEEIDDERYQTTYATHNGSVAAPTAGLHFTNNLNEKLFKKNIKTAFATLHVGAGTFKPVKSKTIQEHEMHAEHISVTKAFILTLLNHYSEKRKTVVVGTTSLRITETLYWMGVKTILNPAISQAELNIDQWEAYELTKENFSAEVALKSLLQWMENNKIENFFTKTQILIAPGYNIKTADGIFTNFHLPQSTLLLLIAAFVGKEWKKIYDHALKHNYRFLSYGDGSLLWKNKA